MTHQNNSIKGIRSLNAYLLVKINVQIRLSGTDKTNEAFNKNPSETEILKTL